MAVTIVQRPAGNVFGSALTGSVSSSYGTTDATVYTIPPHGLTDGQYIYVASNIENYNGFLVVDSTGTYTFKLRRFDADSYVPYLQDAQITYYVSTYFHGWSAVHLPIVYRLSSDKYPANTVDTTRNVNSVVNDNGFVLLNISGSLGSDVKTYDSVKLTAPNQTDISGVYQIFDWISSTVVVINLTYSSAYNWSGATVQRYYNNYNVMVKVYGGLNSLHQWAAQKPYELLSTLQLIPRTTDNDVIFSVNDIVKSKVKTENNLTLGTLPNNIDDFSQFYIEYAESYDKSDGYTLGTYTSAYSSDQSLFEGYAANAKLPFKNQYAGFMSEYIMSTGLTGKFLTLFQEPVLFNLSYQDISIIKDNDYDLQVNFQYYLNGVAGTLTTQTLTGDAGIYRIPLTTDCNFNRVDVTVYITIPPLASITTSKGALTVTGYAPQITVGPPA